MRSRRHARAADPRSATYLPARSRGRASPPFGDARPAPGPMPSFIAYRTRDVALAVLVEKVVAAGAVAAPLAARFFDALG